MNNKRTKRTLKTWVKVTILLIIAIVIYNLCGTYGYMASESNTACGLIVGGWMYLFFGQFAIASIWIDK